MGWPDFVVYITQVTGVATLCLPNHRYYPAGHLRG